MKLNHGQRSLHESTFCWSYKWNLVLKVLILHIDYLWIHWIHGYSAPHNMFCCQGYCRCSGSGFEGDWGGGGGATTTTATATTSTTSTSGSSAWCCTQNHRIRVHHHEKECDAMYWCSCGAHASHVNPDMPWFSCKRNTTPNRQTRSLGVCVGNVWRDVKLLPVWLLPLLASYLSMILGVPSIAFMLLLMVSFYGAEIWVFSEFRPKKAGGFILRCWNLSS